MKNWRAGLVASVFYLLFTGSVSAIDVTISSTMGEAFPIGINVTFTADATDTNPVTTYTWSFGDGTPDVVTMVPTVNHIFAVDDIYDVSVEVNNGVDPTPGFDFAFFEAFVSPLVTDPLGTNANDPPTLNPDAGISFAIAQSLGGFISGNLSVKVPDPSDGFTTDFGDGTSDRHGTFLQHRYKDTGIFIMESDHTQAGSVVGKLRKTLVFSEQEILGANSDPMVITPTVDKRKLVFKSIKGKFYFNSGGVLAARQSRVFSDTVSVSWSMTLPAGMDLSAAAADISIGNVVDTIDLKTNGAGVITQPSPYKAVRFAFPRLKHGQTRSTKETVSRVTVSMSAANLTGAGFDTEGISPLAHQLSNSKGPFLRSIQVATFIAGVSYSGIATVNLSISGNDSFGSMTTRH